MAKCLYFHLFIVDGSMQYIIRLRRLHAVHRCGCLLQMLHVAWSVCVCVCVRVLGIQMTCAKTVELIKLPFWG